MILTKEQLEERVSSKDNIARSVTSLPREGFDGPAREDSISNLVKEGSPAGLETPEINEASVSEPQVIYKRFGINEKGRNGGKNLTPEERVAIGTLANLEGKDVTAEVFGISERTASHLRTAQVPIVKGHGAENHTTTFNIDMDLRAKIQERLENTKLSATDLAAERLLRSLGCITDDKLENCSVKDAAQVSSQLSSVIRNLNGSYDRNNRAPAAKIVLIQPKASKEESFDVIEIGVERKEM